MSAHRPVMKLGILALASFLASQPALADVVTAPGVIQLAELIVAPDKGAQNLRPVRVASVIRQARIRMARQSIPRRKNMA